MASRYEHGKPSRNDPFYEPPMHKAFYHPTREKHLQDNQKWTALAPDRDKQPPDDRDIHFLQPTNTYTDIDGASPGDTSSKFNESWPASERPSTLDALQDDSNTTVPTHDSSLGPMKPLSDLLRQFGVPPQTGSSGANFVSEISRVGDMSTLSQATTSTEPANRISTLSKYIERFRHGAPLSREERHHLKSTDPTDFWWMRGTDSPQGSSTPRGGDTSTTSQEAGSTRLRGQPLSARSRMTSESSRGHRRSDLDSETLRLMDKTDKILERSTSTLDSSAPIVSTVGLGSDTSSTSTFHESTGRPPEKSYLPSFVGTGKSTMLGSTVQKPLRPEDDILHQWRQQRRMEALRNRASYLLESNSAPSAEVVDQVESKLADFRRRVMTGQPDKTPQTRHTESKLTDRKEDVLLPAPKADAVCQTLTDAICQTSLDAETTTNPRPTTPTHAPISSVNHSSPVASPSMARRRGPGQTVGADLEPHYHLSCDILPCPHEHFHSPKATKAKSSHEEHFRSPKKKSKPRTSGGRSPQESRKHKSYLSDTDTDESRPPSSQNKTVEEPVKDIGPLVIDSCSDVEYENYKRRHMEEVRSELESQSGASTSRSEIERETDRKRGRETRERERRRSHGEKHEKDEVRYKDDHKETYGGDGQGKNSKEKNGFDCQEGGRKGHGQDRDRSREREGSRESSLERGQSRERDQSRETEQKRSKSRDRKSKERDRDVSSTSSKSNKSSRSKAESTKSHQSSTSQKQKDPTCITDKSEDNFINKSKHSDPQRGQSSQRNKSDEHTRPKLQQSSRAPQPSARVPQGSENQPTKKGKEEPGKGRKRAEVVRGSLTDASICDSTPLAQSSPIHNQRAVTPTIQQVVTERLFEDTEVEEEEAEQTLSENITDDVLAAGSEGEEYQDDELLQDLRARREQYQQRLEVLDQLLTFHSES